MWSGLCIRVVQVDNKVCQDLLFTLLEHGHNGEITVRVGSTGLN